MPEKKKYDKEDILSDNLIIADYKDMSRKNLEKFADQMRIDRNSFLIELEIANNEVKELKKINRNEKQKTKM